MIPLYIQGKTGTLVTLKQPALSVVSPEKTRLLFPLSRISRVVVSGDVAWSMAALFACADTGINIIFLNQSGQVRCQWLATSSKKTSVAQLFSDLFQRRNAFQHYQNWLLGMRRMASRSASRRIGLKDWQVIDAGVLNAYFFESLHESWSSIIMELKAFLLSSVLQYLADLGFDTQYSFMQNEHFNLADDMAELLLWDFYPAILLWRQESYQMPEQALIVSFYQQRSQRVDQLLRGLLNRLHQCLRESV